jgi:hypothetical protein
VKPSLLLDAHLSDALAAGLVSRGFDVLHVKDWQGKDLRNASDEEILAAATVVARVVVTRDTKTFPAMAGRWTAAGRAHAGVIVISPRMNNRDIGGELQAIVAIIDEVGQQSWENLVVYTHR